MLDQLRETGGRGEAKRLVPVARTAGYTGSDRNSRRLAAELKRQVRGEIGRHQRLEAANLERLDNGVGRRRRVDRPP